MDDTSAVGDEPAKAVGQALDRFLASRSERSFRALYRLVTPRLWRLARRLLSSPEAAEEAVQETWLRTVRSLDGFGRRSSFTTWASGILIHCCREQLRAVPREAGTSELPENLPELTPSASLDRLAVEEALGRLPPGYRGVLVLHDLEGHTHREIADLLSIAPGTSKSQLTRARRHLRRLLSRPATCDGALPEDL